MVKKDRYYLTVGDFNKFIKQSFYRTKYKAPKSEQVEKIVGMSRNEFIEHLEETFKNRYGISTEEYLKYFPYRSLCIDHIKPLRTANSRNEVELLCHYSNLQLLICRDNLVKDRGTDITICHEDLKSKIEFLKRSIQRDEESM